MNEPPEAPRSGTAAAIDAFWLILAANLSQLVTFGLGLMLRRELGPAGMGYIAVTQLITGYTAFLGLGAMQAAEREIPIAIARGDETEARSLELAAVAVALLVSVLAGAGLLAIGVLRSETESLLGAALVCASFSIVIGQISTWAVVRLRTRLRFRVLAWRTAVATVAASLLAVIGAWVGGAVGALVGMVIGGILQALILVRAARIGGLAVPPRSAFRRLAALSPAFLASGVIAMLLLTVDQLAVGFTLGSSSLGLYSAAYLGYAFVLRVPNLISTVVYPRLQRELGTSSDAGRVFAMTSRTTGVLVMTMPVLVGVSTVVLPAVVFLALPQFRGAVDPMRLLLIGVTGLAFAMPAAGYLLTVNRQKRQVTISGSALAIMACAYLVAEASGTMSLEYAAGVDTVAYLGYGFVMQVAAYRVAGQPIRRLLRLMPMYVIPAAELLAGAIAADAVVPQHDAMGVLVHAGLQAGLFGLAWAALAWLYVRAHPETRGDLLMVIALMGPAVGRIRAALRRLTHPRLRRL